MKEFWGKVKVKWEKVKVKWEKVVDFVEDNIVCRIIWYILVIAFYVGISLLAWTCFIAMLRGFNVELSSSLNNWIDGFLAIFGK